MTELAKLLAQLDGREFEYFIRDLWAAREWDTQITPKSGDDGTDIILERQQFYYQKKLVQTKCIQPEDNLSRDSVQQYSYLLHQNNVDEALLITTGGFTDGAKQSAETVNLKLIDGKTLESLVLDTIDKSQSEFDPQKYVPTYDFDAATDQPDTKDTLIPNSGPIDLSEIPSELHSTVEELSNQTNIYDRLLATLGNEQLSLDIRLSILFQQFRGKDPFHVLFCIGAENDYRSLLNRVVELQQPSQTEHVNCLRADVETVVGTGPKSTVGQLGLISELDRGVLVLSEFGLNEGIQNHLVEPLDAGKIRFTKRGTHDTSNVSFSALAAGRPKYRSWDKYEPMGEQIPFGASVMTSFDVFICGGFKEESSLELPETVGNNNVESVEERIFKFYCVIANELEPELTDNASVLLDNIESKIKVAVESEPNVSDSEVPQWMNTLRRAAQASARMKLREAVVEEDIRRASVVLPQNQYGIDFYDLVKNPTTYTVSTDDFDKEVVETGTSKTQGDRIKNIKQLVAEIEDEFEDGAPVEKVLERAGEIGMEATKAEKEIENLRRKAEIYEPTQGHLRTSGTTSTTMSKAQRDRLKNIKQLIAEIEDEFEEGAPVEEIYQRSDEIGMTKPEAKDEIENLRRKGELYEPIQNYLRTT